MDSKTTKGIEFARRVLSGESWVPTPLLPALTMGSRLGVELWLKREDCTPIGAFKLRGAMVAMASLADGLPEGGVYVPSSGNYGLAIALAGQRSSVQVTVVVPEGRTPPQLERIRLCGARVIQYGKDYDTAKDFARASASKDGAAFWEDGLLQEMALGSATIGAELLDHTEPWDLVIVPMGGGSLIKGIAEVFKARSRQTKVVGTVPAGAPAMAYAFRGQHWDEAATIDTYAAGLAVRVPIRDMVEEHRRLVDDVWLVDESKLLPAVRSLIELEHVMVEPSSAITIAGLAERRDQVQGKRVAAIVTGANLQTGLIPTVMDAAELF